MQSSYYNIQKTYLSGVLARDIAEPLPSFDAGTPAAAARAFLEASGGVVVGVRSGGFVTAFAEYPALGEGSCGDCAQPLDPERIFPDDAPMPVLIHALNVQPYIFVRMLGAVSSIVTRADLEDAPVRMWLFGLLSTIEGLFVALIEQYYGTAEGGAWQTALSPARIAKATELQAERRRRRLNDELLHCLQFADKGQIVARDETLRTIAGFASRKRADQRIKEMERLRNNLAHGQEIVASDWEAIVTLAENLERVASLSAGRRELLGARTQIV